MEKYKAFIFDLNGTMIDDMRYHIDAWHNLFNKMNAGISWDETRFQCYGKNHEMLERVFPGRFTEEEKDKISMEKEKQYRERFEPQLRLVDGLDIFLGKAKKQGIKIGIGSAAMMMNIDFVLDGLDIRHYFDAIVSADDVPAGKPDPGIFLKCAEELVTDPSECLVFEDSPMGTEAAKNAGMDAVVLTTLHEPWEFKPGTIISFAKDFTGNLYHSIEMNS
ncbi:MAG TPA: HAD family phosphatase [Chitinophagaceae bacterium]|nr:HAD family phosphatase [Chitinophagaceae bacterium]